MTLRGAIFEWKGVCKSFDDGSEPRKDALSRETELAVKAAREDVCANIDLAITVVLFATGHWILGIAAAIWTAFQFAEAAKWEILLRIERRKMMNRGG